MQRNRLLAGDRICRGPPVRTEDEFMLESTVELLCDLFLGSLTLLIGASVVGSIVAALRAVRDGTSMVRGLKRHRFVA